MFGRSVIFLDCEDLLKVVFIDRIVHCTDSNVEDDIG